MGTYLVHSRTSPLVAAIAALACVASSCLAQQDGAFQPGQPWPDSNGVHINAHGYCILRHDGVYHWYGSHKIAGRTESEKNEAGVRLYTSTNLYHWEDRGLVLSVYADGMHPDVADAGILDRPKVVYNEHTHRFLLYFKLYPPKATTSGKKVAYTGVASSRTARGPFEYKCRFLGADSPDGSGDFAIFKDDDGDAYHITVRKPDKRLVCGRLSEDGLKPGGGYAVMEGVLRAIEAPAMFKKDGRYYLLGSDSTGWRPNAARVFVADNLDGPYTLLGNPTVGTNPHNGLGPAKTFGGQSTFVLPAPCRSDAWIAMFDIWNPSDPINAGYIWLPLVFDGDQPVIQWRDKWDLTVFDQANHAPCE